jgi:hypothetical protein
LIDINASFSDVEQIQKKLAEASAAAAEKNKPATTLSTPLTSGEISVIEAYTDGAYRALNSALRSGKKLTLDQAVMAKQLDNAIRKSTLSKDYTLRRGITSKGVMAIFGGDVSIGDVVMDNGFMSSSKGEGFDSNIKLVINLPKGSHGLDVQSISAHTSEAEVILPRGSMFKVKSVSKSGANKLKLEVDHVEL